MPRGIDHIIHAVHDLDAAVTFYKGLGFTVGARNKHPREWGTQNHIIQTPGVFIELLAVTDPDGIEAHGPQRFSFGAFNRDFLAHAEGMSMLVLKGLGAPDADDFRARGIGDFAPYAFEREGRRPDGAKVKVAFSLAFARDPAAPDAGFFTCRHHYPQNFWNPTFQKHANGTTGVAGVVAVAGEPEQHRAFMQAFTAGEATATEGGFSIATPYGVIDMLTPAAFVARYGVNAPDISRGARLAAVRFSVVDAGLMQNIPELVGIAGLYEGNAAIIGANDALGAVIIFEAAR